MNIEIKINKAELAKLAKIPFWLQHNAIDKALKAMSTPIIAKAKAIAPSSRSSGTRNKWSKKFQDNTKWKNDSGQATGVKVSKTNKGAIAYVGSKHPMGNKQQFNQVVKKGHRDAFYWGKPGQTITTRSRSGNTYTYVRKNKGGTYRPPYRFMQRAYDETRSQQDAAFVASIQSSFGSMNLG